MSQGWVRPIMRHSHLQIEHESHALLSLQPCHHVQYGLHVRRELEHAHALRRNGRRSSAVWHGHLSCNGWCSLLMRA
jgi:hypothetical protein